MTTPSGFRAEGFWNETPVCRRTPLGRVHATSASTAASATDVLDDTALGHGSTITHIPALRNPPKRYTIENVKKNYLVILFEPAKSGNAGNALPVGSTAFIPVALCARGL